MRARSAGMKRATPSPPEREVPKSWVKRGTSRGERMEKVYDIVGTVRWYVRLEVRDVVLGPVRVEVRDLGS